MTLLHIQSEEYSLTGEKPGMDMKRDYYEDVQLFTSGVVFFWFIALLALLAAYPFIVKNYYVYVANYIAINIIVVIGLNILVGYTGQISLGHAGLWKKTGQVFVCPC